MCVCKRHNSVQMLHSIGLKVGLYATYHCHTTCINFGIYLFSPWIKKLYLNSNYFMCILMLLNYLKQLHILHWFRKHEKIYIYYFLWDLIVWNAAHLKMNGMVKTLLQYNHYWEFRAQHLQFFYKNTQEIFLRENASQLWAKNINLEEINTIL